jgi:hypothetical protein
MMSDGQAANGRAPETTPHSPAPDALLRLPPRRLAVLLSGASERDPSLRRLLADELRSLPPPADGDMMVGESPAMQLVFDRIRRFAATESPVLIAGESGTGKELAARAMHERSARAGGPFVAINCAALPPSLIASELFGHEKGAFTGAVGRKIGLIERAHGGTLFLDEVGDLPGETQGHLLRFLQDLTLLRVGGTQQLRVDARILSATNVPLAEAIRERRFREDLFLPPGGAGAPDAAAARARPRRRSARHLLPAWRRAGACAEHQRLLAGCARGAACTSLARQCA